MEAVSEYISRDTILKALADSEPKEEDWRLDNAENYDLRKIRFLAASNVYEEIKEVLSCDRLLADVAPVVHGKWVEPSYKRKKAGICGSTDAMAGKCRCSVCRHEEPVFEEYPKYNYCPNCGAKMDESKDKSE